MCAIRAAQLGLKVAVVEKRATFGGTCLNVGCIPSKALLHASELYEEAQHGFGRMGIGVEPTLDLGRMLAFKDEGVKGNVDGVAYLLKKNKIETVLGTGRIAAPGVVDVAQADGGTIQLQTKAIVIATGSDVARLPGIDIDEQQVVSSTGALSLPEVPKRMLVVGAGVIGLELGSVWRRLGSEVTVVEFLDRILPGMDGEVAKTLERLFTKQGMAFKLGSKVTGVQKNGAGLDVTIEPAKGEAAQPKPSAPMSCWFASGACRSRKGLGSLRRASCRTTAGASSSTASSRPTSRAFSPSETSSRARCWRTRPRTRALPWPKFSPGRPEASITTSFRT